MIPYHMKAGGSLGGAESSESICKGLRQELQNMYLVFDKCGTCYTSIFKAFCKKSNNDSNKIII